MKLCRTGPVGPWLVTADEVPGPQALSMRLEPGDIITTGTPPGLGQKPEPWFLKPGDVVELGIEGLGQQRQNFVAAKG